MQIYIITIEEEGDSVEEVMESSHENVPNSTDSNVEVKVSLQAIDGGRNYQTLLIKRKSKKVLIIFFIDSGSTHNFLDPSVAKQIRCSIVPTSTRRW